jgi:hypothetical protein
VPKSNPFAQSGTVKTARLVLLSQIGSTIEPCHDQPFALDPRGDFALGEELAFFSGGRMLARPLNVNGQLREGLAWQRCSERYSPECLLIAAVLDTPIFKWTVVQAA